MKVLPPLFFAVNAPRTFSNTLSNTLVNIRPYSYNLFEPIEMQ